MTGAPLERAHRTDRVRRYRRRGEVLRGLLAGLVAVTMVLATPVLLVAVAGNPLPGTDGGVFTGPTARAAVKVAACLGWLGWAQLLACLLVETHAGVRGQGLPRRVRLAAAPMQDLTRRLVVAMLLVAADQTLHSATVPGSDAGAGIRPDRDTGVPTPQQPQPRRVAPGSAPLAWDVARAGLLAAGLVDALAAVRRRTAATRPPGSGVLLPDAEAAGVEVAARVGADHDGAAFLDRALRGLSVGLAGRDRSVPEFYAARLSPDRLELLVVTPDGAPPYPFVAEDAGTRWCLSRTVEPPWTNLDPAAPAPLPTLWSVGTDHTGARVLVDLESVRGTLAVTGDPDAARSLVAAAAIELATNRWSDHVRITLVGFGHAIRLVSPDRIRCVDTVAEAAADLVARVSNGQRALAAAGIDSVLTARVRQLAGVGHVPHLVVLATPPGRTAPTELAALAALEAAAAEGTRAPLGILVAGSTASARVLFTVGRDGAVQAGPLGQVAAGQGVTARSFAGLTRLVQTLTATPTGPPEAEAGPGGDEAERVRRALAAPSGVGPNLPGPVGPVDPDAPVGVLLRILGEPAVDAPGLPPPGSPLVVEICLYLALRGPVSVAELAAAMWPFGIAEPDREAVLYRVRDWLGHGPDGHPRLRRDANRVVLSGDVRVDWHLFVALARRGTDGDLRAALDLVRGPLAEPRPAHRYGWLSADPVGYQAVPHIVDVAHRHWCRRMELGDHDGALAAARAGLRAEPVAEALWHDLATAVRVRDGDAAADALLASRRPR